MSTTKTQVLARLKEEQDPRGIANWKKHVEDSGGLSSYGIGLTRLRKLAKEFGRDPKLAKQLWKSKVYDAKIVSLLVDDPKTMTIEQAESQVEELQGGYLAHVFSSCDAPLAKTPFVVELCETWIANKKDAMRRRCGYGLLYEISKSKKKSAPDEAWFLDHVKRMEKVWSKETPQMLCSLGGALMGIGMRSKKLHKPALKLAKEIGPIHFDPTGKCDPMDVAKNLTSPTVKQRLGL